MLRASRLTSTRAKSAKPLPDDLKGPGQLRAALANPGVDGGGGEPVPAADFLGVEPYRPFVDEAVEPYEFPAGRRRGGQLGLGVSSLSAATLPIPLPVARTTQSPND